MRRAIYFLSSLRNKLAYYLISIIAFVLLLVHSINVKALNADYSIMSFIKNPYEYGMALLSGIILIFTLCLLIIGCLWRWSDIFNYSEKTVDYIDGALRSVIAIGSGITCYMYFNVVVTLLIGMSIACIMFRVLFDN